jgi:hypothetical protein
MPQWLLPESADCERHDTNATSYMQSLKTIDMGTDDKLASVVLMSS